MFRAFLLLLLAALPSAACIWDRDTLREEAKGKLDTVGAITGWFDRYPPKYYEMRLERVIRELAGRPDALDLYDDAGVACSRLGRHDESIAWMAKKKEILDSRPAEETKEERYRYLSNLGTFHLLRWASRAEEARFDELSELEASESLIARALELNPGAHFGREKFQLMLIRWLLETSSPETVGHPNFLGLWQNHWSAPNPGSESEGFTLREAREGISGLIQLGAAWESIDSFHTLQLCLHADRMMPLSHLAHLRMNELYERGGRSLHPVQEIRDQVVPEGSDGFRDRAQVEAFYRKARQAAIKRETEWLAYQEKRFGLGMHPDTHADFWKDWREPEFPKMPGPSLLLLAERNPGTALLVFCGATVLGIAGLVATFKRIKARFSRRKEAQA